MNAQEERIGNAHVVRLGLDLWAAYDALTMDVVFVSRSGLDSLRGRWSNGGTPESPTLDIAAIARTHADHELLDEYQQQFETTAGLFALWLILTDNCNLRCSYCSFFSHLRPDHQFGRMSNDIVGASLTLLQKQSRRHSSPLAVVFYGGEPLLNPTAIRHALKLMGEMDWGNSRRPESVIVTNGTLLSPEILNEFGQYGSDIIISIDGTPEMNDAYRNDIVGQSTYGRVADACDRVSGTRGTRLAFSITLGKHNAGSIGEVLRFLKQRFNPNSVGLNPLHINPDGRVNPWDITLDESADAMIDAFTVGREIGIYIEQVVRKVRAFVRKTPRSVDCPACGGMIECYPNGKFGPCGHFVALGQHSLSAQDYADSDLELLLGLWRKRTSHTLVEESQCARCMARGICGGGCPLTGHKRTGSIYSADERVCVLARKLIVWLLEDLWEQVNKNRGELLLGESDFVVPTQREREMILGNIDLERPRALASYSEFGELHLGG